MNREKEVKSEKTKDHTFTKEQLLSSEIYQDRRDLIFTLLEEEQKYTLQEVELKIKQFLKRSVS